MTEHPNDPHAAATAGPMRELLARLDVQAAQLERQRLDLEHLRDQLAALDGVAASPERVGDGAERDGRRSVLHRREVLTKGAAAAAGAVAATTGLVVSQAPPAAAATGSFLGNPAVNASASPDTGLGAFITTNSGKGIFGLAGSGIGVWGETGDGVGVCAATGNLGSHLRLLPSSMDPPPASSTQRDEGSIVVDKNHDLWCCVAGGTPGTWRRISGPSVAGGLTPLMTPVRVYDSRPGYAPALGTKSSLAAGVARSCDLKANGSGVPAGATAVLVNLVATGTTGAAGGFLSIYRNGVAWPGTSSLNWSGPGQNVAVTTLTTVDADAVCNLYANVATNVVVDVIGYHR